MGIVFVDVNADDFTKLGLVEYQDIDQLSNSRSKSIAGAELRIVVAPAACALEKNAVIVGIGISN